MGKQYKNKEQVALGDGLTIYLRETYPDKPLRHYGSPATIQWSECGMEKQDLTPYHNNHWYYTKQAWERIHSGNRQYPPIENQLDMIYWDKINGTNNWVETITKIKEEIPKCPEFVEPEPVEYFEPTQSISSSNNQVFKGSLSEAMSFISEQSGEESLKLLQDMIDKQL